MFLRCHDCITRVLLETVPQRAFFPGQQRGLNSVVSLLEKPAQQLFDTHVRQYAVSSLSHKRQMQTSGFSAIHTAQLLWRESRAESNAAQTALTIKQTCTIHPRNGFEHCASCEEVLVLFGAASWYSMVSSCPGIAYH